MPSRHFETGQIIWLVVVVAIPRRCGFVGTIVVVVVIVFSVIIVVVVVIVIVVIVIIPFL